MLTCKLFKKLRNFINFTEPCGQTLKVSTHLLKWVSFKGAECSKNSMNKLPIAGDRGDPYPFVHKGNPHIGNMRKSMQIQKEVQLYA